MLTHCTAVIVFRHTDTWASAVACAFSGTQALMYMGERCRVARINMALIYMGQRCAKLYRLRPHNCIGTYTVVDLKRLDVSDYELVRNVNI